MLEFPEYKVYIKTAQTVVEVELIVPPIGLENYSNKLMRHNIYNTILVDVTLELDFVKDGYDILRAAFEVDKWNAKATIRIMEIEPKDLTYDEIYTGDFDFENYSEKELVIKIPSVNSGRVAKVRTREKNNYNLEDLMSTDTIAIPPFASDKITMKFPPFNYSYWAIAIMNYNLNFIDPLFAVDYTVKPSINGTIEQNTIGEDFSFNTNKIYTNSKDSAETVILSGVVNQITMNGSLTNDPKTNLTIENNTQIIVKNSNDVITQTITLYNNSWHYQLGFSGTINEGTTTPISLDNNITLQSGDYLYINSEWILDIDTIGGDTLDINVTFITDITGFEIITTAVSLPDFYNYAWLPFEAFSRLIQLMTSETDLTKLLDSDILGRTDSEPVQYLSDGALSKLAHISGLALRGGLQNTSFLELFQSINAINPIGFWYNKTTDKFEIKDVSEYYKNVQIAKFGEVDNLTIEVDKTGIKSMISGGYNYNTDNELINGIIEFNGKISFSAPITFSKLVQDISSVFRADTVGICYPEAKATLNQGDEDFSTDKNNFILDSERDGNNYKVVTGSDIFATDGLKISDTFYNVRITPKRNLLKNGAFIRSYCDSLGTKEIQFINSKNILNFGTQLTSGDPMIYEHDNIIINSLQTPYFEPILYKFEYQTKKDLRNQIKADPHGYIEFDWKGETFKGFIKDVTLNSSKNKGTFILIKKYEQFAP